EIDVVAVLGAVRLIGQPPDREQVRRVEEREAVLTRQALGSLDLFRDRVERWILGGHAARRMASVTLWPPKPNEFDRATSTWRFTALLGAESRSQAGSGVNWLTVGGMAPRWPTGAAHGAARARAGGDAVAGALRVNLRAAVFRMLPFFQDEHGRAVPHHEAVAVLVERPTRRGGVVVPLGERLHVGEACDRKRGDRGFGAACDHDVRLIVA